MTDPAPSPIVLHPDHFRALRRLKGLATHGLTTLAEDLREEMSQAAGHAHDFIAKELAELTSLRTAAAKVAEDAAAKAKADAEIADKAAAEIIANAPKAIPLPVADPDHA